MPTTALDLDSPQSWPEELLDYLERHHDFPLRWETNRSQPYDPMSETAIEGLSRGLQPYEILGWHCTRLTCAEAAEIQCNGMQLPNAEMLERRIDTLVKTGCITPDIARRLKSENQADAKNRAGMVWFCFFPPGDAGESGIERFFRHWGGEALYWGHEDDPVISPAISCIGTPRIVKAVVPIALLPENSGKLARYIYSRYLEGHGVRTYMQVGYEHYIVNPLPAENVRRIISFPEPDFCSLTGCCDWRNPIRNNQPDTNCT